MTLKNSDDILFQLNILKDNPNFTKEQQEVIQICIDVVTRTPIETNYKYAGNEIEKATKSIKYRREF